MTTHDVKTLGAQATLLTVVPYEHLLLQPLEDVWRLLRIEPAREAHPDGIIVGNRGGQSGQWVMAH